MALAAEIVWEVRTGGSDNNGGGFKAGASGSDFTQQDAAQATLTAASVVHTTTTQINVSAGDYTVTNNDVGNTLNVTGGTATAGEYEITAVDIPNNRWTVDRSVGTAGQTVVGKMGGGFASLGRAGQFSVSNNKIYIKSGTYTITSATQNIAGGCFSNTSNFRYIEGYQTTRGDLGTPPLLQADGVITNFTVITLTTGNHGVFNVNVDCNSRANSVGININGGTLYKSKVSNAPGGGINLNGNAVGIRCEVTGCGTAGFSVASMAHSCYAHDNTATGFSMGGTSSAVNCISDSNSGAGSDGFSSGSFTGMIVNCVAYNNGRDGFRINNQMWGVINCIAEANAGIGFNVTNASPSGDADLFFTCAGFNNTGGNVTINAGGLFSQSLAFIAGSASFFVDPANGNFALNNNAGGGAAVRAAAFPGSFPGGLSTGFLDVGAIQSQGSGGGGGSQVTSVSAVLRRQNVLPYRTGYSS